MLTSIKEAFNNERYYDAVSNNINSTIVDYSKPSDLQKESKVIVEDSYKDIKPNIDVLNQIATESYNMLEIISERAYPAIDRIKTMKSSFSTESAFSDFMNIAAEKFINLLKSLVEKIINMYNILIGLMKNVKNVSFKLFKIKTPVEKNAISLKRFLASKGLSSMPASNIISNSSNMIDFKEVVGTELKSNRTKFEQYLEMFKLENPIISNKGYLNRIKERGKILEDISSYVNDFSSKSSNLISNYDKDKGESVQIELIKLKAQLKKMITTFFNFVDDGDISAFVIREYEIIPAYKSELHQNSIRDVTINRCNDEKLLFDNIYSNKRAVLDRVNNLSSDNVFSISSPLQSSDINNKIISSTLANRSFNVKDLFGNLSCDELLDIIIDTSKYIEDCKNKYTNTSGFTSVYDSVDKISKESKTILQSYNKELEKLRHSGESDTEDSLRRAVTVLQSKMFADIAYSTSAMCQIIQTDVTGRYYQMIEMLNSLNKILIILKDSTIKYLEKNNENS